MEDQENSCVRVTRAARKRAAAAAALSTVDDRPPSKKRVVLGELRNLPNVVVPTSTSAGDVPRKRKVSTRSTAANNKSKPKAKKATFVNREDESTRIDAESDDPQMCGPYASDIYDYLHKLEMDPRRRPLPDYIEAVQKDVSASMRAILVDWLVEVAEEYKLVSDTLYLAIDYIDRYLSKNSLNRQRLQLLGVSSMLIASKYEEINPPKVEDFCYITDNTSTQEEVVKMEADILKSLNFELGNPTIKTFLRKITRIAQEDYKNPNLHLEFLGYYLAELSLLDYTCVKFWPSLVASSVAFLARFMLQPKMHPWTSALQQHSLYKPSDLKECVLIIHDLYLSRRGGGLQSVREKYKQHKFKCVATMASPPDIPAAYFEGVQ